MTSFIAGYFGKSTIVKKFPKKKKKNNIWRVSYFHASSLAKGYDSGPPSLHPWQI